MEKRIEVRLDSTDPLPNAPWEWVDVSTVGDHTRGVRVFVGGMPRSVISISVRQRRVAQPTVGGIWQLVPMDRPVDFTIPFLVFSDGFTEPQINTLLSILNVDANLSPPSRYKPAASMQDSGDTCKVCGGILTQTGTCKTCTSCGFNEGCG